MTNPSNTTYGLFHAILQFPSALKLQEWQNSLIDFDADGTKERLAPISKIWMDDYPRTNLFGENIGFVSKEKYTPEEALEHFNQTSSFKISKEELGKIETTEKGDKTYYNFHFKGKLEHPLKIDKFLSYLQKNFSNGEEYFEIQLKNNGVEISAYLGSYDAIEDYTEALFLMLILANKFQGTGDGFLVPDNYYDDFYDFINFESKAGTIFHLECNDLQNASEDFQQKVEKIEPLIKENYETWRKSHH